MVQPERVTRECFWAMPTFVISVGMPPFDVRSDGILGRINVRAVRAGDVEFGTVESEMESEAEHGRIRLAALFDFAIVRPLVGAVAGGFAVSFEAINARVRRSTYFADKLGPFFHRLGVDVPNVLLEGFLPEKVLAALLADMDSRRFRVCFQVIIESALVFETVSTIGTRERAIWIVQYGVFFELGLGGETLVADFARKRLVDLNSSVFTMPLPCNLARRIATVRSRRKLSEYGVKPLSRAGGAAHFSLLSRLGSCFPR
jgi:hypothetical protein